MKPFPVRITSVRNAQTLLLVLICLASAGCAGGMQTSVTVLPPPPVVSSIPQTAPSPTLIPTIISTLTSQPAPTPGLIPIHVPSVCSPLAVQPLKEIKQIVTQPFSMPGVRVNGNYIDTSHPGLDLGYYTRDGVNFTGTGVLAALDGKVAAVIHDRPPYGNMLILETRFEDIPENIISSQKITSGDSLYSLYAHLQNMQALKIGQLIHCGQQIAETGLTGFTGGPHLHFETRWGPPNKVFPVMGDYRGDITIEEMKYYFLWRISGDFHLFDPLDLLDP